MQNSPNESPDESAKNVDDKINSSEDDELLDIIRDDSRPLAERLPAYLELARTGNEKSRAIVAKRAWEVPVAVQYTLAKDQNQDVRINLARTSSDFDILQLLSEDKDERVRLYAIANKHCPATSLRKIAKNLQTPVDILEVLAEKKGDPETLKMLSSSPHQEVRWQLTHNQHTPIDVLIALAKDNDVHVRYGVADNERTPENVLRKMIEEDPEEIVREAAQENLNGYWRK